MDLKSQWRSQTTPSSLNLFVLSSISYGVQPSYWQPFTPASPSVFKASFRQPLLARKFKVNLVSCFHVPNCNLRPLFWWRYWKEEIYIHFNISTLEIGFSFMLNNLFFSSSIDLKFMFMSHSGRCLSLFLYFLKRYF